MKIGILTHHYINNFGAFLQAYSLQQSVQQLHPEDDVYIIDDINLKHFVINYAGWFRFNRNKDSLSTWLQKVKTPRTFALSRKKYLRLTTRCLKTKEVDMLGLDCIIVGSDEVWNYTETKGNHRIKFGEGLSCFNLIAYAPSVGNTKEVIVPKYVVEGIKKFKSVSARDDLTEDLADSIRIEKTIRVVDPTFLFEIPNEPVPNIKSPFIIFYYCDGMDRKEKDKIFRYAEENGCAVYGAGETDKNYESITVNITPFQWVWLIKNAKYVVTGTFHGVVFSLLNHRQFACYLTNPSRINKVKSLLDEFGLADRRTSGNAIEIIDRLERIIDYDKIDKIAEDKISQSKRYLINSITGR